MWIPIALQSGSTSPTICISVGLPTLLYVTVDHVIQCKGGSCDAGHHYTASCDPPDTVYRGLRDISSFRSMTSRAKTNQSKTNHWF